MSPWGDPRRSPPRAATSAAAISQPYGLHWFRRDLRVAGNPALRWSWNEHQGRVLGVFCFDASFLARPDFSVDRFAFFLDSLWALRDELRRAGGDLLVLDKAPGEAFPALLDALDRGRIPPPATLSFNRDYEPFARTRDQAVSALVEKGRGIIVHTESDHLLIEPHEIRKELRAQSTGDELPYFKVYSAFARRWFALLATPRIQARLEAQRKGLAYLDTLASLGGGPNQPLFKLSWPALFGSQPLPEDHLQRFVDANRARVRVPIPAAGSVAARARLHAFGPRLSSYKRDRDLPGLDGTSRMSIYFKNGSFTPAQVIAELKLGSTTLAEGSGASSFLREIVWREFYYHLLWHRPDVETRSFLPQYRDLAWENRSDWFEAWKAGETGYPIVDAGMRQLAQTGWMHNRVRMIVASFLTKDLLIDWRWGERYFMERLLDGDLAPNNGGWQWAASTGCDPQPYFRVFNPSLQGRRFDPDGAYLRTFLPERRDDDAVSIHQPRQPIVDHAAQKVKALALYRRQP